jgi:hypothetical protein
MQLLLADARNWTLNVDSCQGGDQRSIPTVAEYGAGVSAQSLQVLVKQADLDKGRRNDGLTSEELRQPRRKVRCLCRV